MNYTYVFGPVMSGRLGLSLGLDLLGCRACSMDCIYCEVGATDILTLERKVYAPAKDILAELRQWASLGIETEYVTLGGSGEPCLNTDMGAVIKGVRRILPGKKVAVLTNSTLLTNPEVRRELAAADVVLPSMDTLVEAEFRRINRTHKDVSPLDIAEAMLIFRREFPGLIYLEILLAKGYNDSNENLARLKDFVAQLQPNRVDVTTLSRPGTMATVKGVAPDVLAYWRKELGSTDIASKPMIATTNLPLKSVLPMIKASLARRPQTVLQLATALGTTQENVKKVLELLESTGRLISIAESDKIFFSLRNDA